jgi:hypothetical protein
MLEYILQQQTVRQLRHFREKEGDKSENRQGNRQQLQVLGYHQGTDRHTGYREERVPTTGKDELKRCLRPYGEQFLSPQDFFRQELS